MLFQLVDEVVRRISALDPAREAPAFADQLRRHVPALVQSRPPGVPEAAASRAVETIALVCLKEIRKIPDSVSQMTALLREPTVNPAVACVFVAILAYLVQPRDLIPDDTPGGYGFLDDYVLLRAGEIEWLSTQPGRAAQIAELQKGIGILAALAPAAAKPHLQGAVNELSQFLQIMAMMPQEMQLLTIQMIVANPLAGGMPQAPPGFVAAPGVPVGGFAPTMSWEGAHTWQDGGMMGVNFPGGGGVAADASGVYVL